jgi:hypothetical protein
LLLARGFLVVATTALGLSLLHPSRGGTQAPATAAAERTGPQAALVAAREALESARTAQAARADRRGREIALRALAQLATLDDVSLGDEGHALPGELADVAMRLSAGAAALPALERALA